MSTKESAVLSALSAGQSLAAVARRYHTSPARIATLERSAGRKLALAARLRRMGFTVSEVVEDDRETFAGAGQRQPTGPYAGADRYGKSDREGFRGMDGP
jgi:hypothetical protein